MQVLVSGDARAARCTAIVTGVPAGLALTQRHLDADLGRARARFARGASGLPCTARIESGVLHGRTTGFPIALTVTAPDRAPRDDETIGEQVPVPGSGELPAALKVGADDFAAVRSFSARLEAAARIAAAGIAREVLAEFGVEVASYVTRIGEAAFEEADPLVSAPDRKPLDIELSAVRCPDEEASARMERLVEVARVKGEGLGGAFRLVACGVDPGIGSLCGPERLTARLAAAVFGVEGVSSVEFGAGRAASALDSAHAHDPIAHTPKLRFHRTTNRSGGIEAGVTTGMPIILQATVLPPIDSAGAIASVDFSTFEPARSSRSADTVCRVPEAAVHAEAEIAQVLAQAYLEKFGSEDMRSLTAAVKAYRQRIRTLSS